MLDLVSFINSMNYIIMVKELFEMVGDLFDHLILIKEIRLQEFIETYYHHVKMTDNINE